MTELRTQFTRFLETRNYAPGTICRYVLTVADLAQHYHRRPDRINDEEVQNFLHNMAYRRKLRWSTIHTAVCALHCFYHRFLRHPPHQFMIPTPRLPKRLPLV
ncbi:Phage integrase N-terminal SAM-like domain-containing protein [Sulfidibacter corallicola]|uniref:Phage integrase N-terminal SAM-like domain-containing protein n=1 Tax=Sulfidibacter corallicola TaxID=2818388 RepID=A0A8A4TJB9_SULCO|nr:phage integrase N-terminal SAM-like domain-containing protein [Sulfidibacter corallicola]